MANFWKKLKKPITALAPMDGVTDTTFRQVVASVGKPSVLFTEFVSVDGLCSRGQTRLLNRLRFAEAERPVVAQIWGSDPEKFYRSAKLIKELKFDGIDINMGCPDRQVIKAGGGAALIGNNRLVEEIIQATNKGAGGLPVSVKTRLGFADIVTEEWIGFLLRLNLPALTIHGRTAAEKSDPPARWDEIAKVVRLRDGINSQTLVIGNGDVKSYDDILKRVDEYSVDGVMVGRGIFENIWVFNQNIEAEKITPADKAGLLLMHLQIHLENQLGKVLQSEQAIGPVKKFVRTYIKGFPGAVELREKLVRTQSADEMSGYLNNIGSHLEDYSSLNEATVK